MSEVNLVPDDVKSVIDTHLDGVEQALLESGVSRMERRNVCDELERQILDMLGERSGETPSVGDVRSLLAELDPPCSYGPPASEGLRKATAPVQVSSLATAAAATAILGIAGAFVYAEWRGAESDRQHAAIIAFLITFLALAIGVTAIREIRREHQTKRGYLLAFIGVISLPISFTLWANREIVYPINTQLSQEVANYRIAQRRLERLKEQQGQGEEPLDSNELASEESDVQAKLPFIPWITTQRAARWFSYTTCFGPSLLLAVTLVPFFYRRYHPKTGPAEIVRTSGRTKPRNTSVESYANSAIR